MKNKKTLIIVLCVVLGLLILGGLLWVLFFNKEKEPERKVANTTTDKYVAYIKINPSLKLNYSQKCVEYTDKTVECEDPVVAEYDLVNDDAKEIYKDVDLLAEGKDLATVIQLICKTAEKKGIDTTSVQIQSDWNNLNTYLTEAETKSAKEEISNEKIETGTAESNEATTNHAYVVSVENNESINTTIKVDEEEEAKTKAEAEAKAKAEAEAKAKAEAEAKAKAEAAAKAKEAETINLSNGVTYDHTMLTYECDKCFSNSLINTFKKAKGYHVVEANSSKITFQKITALSKPYNSTKYFGQGIGSKITAAGGENTGGAGGSGDKLTASVCKQFNLTCK